MDQSKKQRAEIFRKFGIIIFLLLLFRSEAVLHIVEVSPVEALLGQDVTLPCVLDDKDQPKLLHDLLTASVRWDKRSADGNVERVYLLTNGTHVAHRAKYNIEENGFRRGNASLSMRNVLDSDEGKYICSIYVTPYKITSEISVQVSARPTVTLTSYELTVEPEHERSVICKVRKFFPKSITIRWFKSWKSSNDRTALDKDTCHGVPAENADGTFNATSLLLVKPSSVAENGDLYSCVVSHRSFKEDEVVNFTLAVQEPSTRTPVIYVAIGLVTCLLLGVAAVVCMHYFYKKAPKISDIEGAEYLLHMEKSNLNCFILNFKPKTVNVKVYLKRVNDSEKHQIRLREPSQNQRRPQSKDGDTEVQLLKKDQLEEPNDLKVELEPLEPKRSFIFYSCPCILYITPNIKTDYGAELTVEVKHPARKSPILKKCILKVSGDCLELSSDFASKHLIHGEEVTLTCNITKYSAGPLQIVWLKKDLMKLKPTQVVYKRGESCDARYSCTQGEREDGRIFTSSSSLTFTANISEDHVRVYICRVNYLALSMNKQLAFNTYIIAMPNLMPITSKPTTPSVGHQMELSCNILRFYPRQVMVQWYKGDDLLTHEGDTTRIDEDGLWSSESTLKLIFETEDFRKTFRCKVYHKSLQDPKVQEWTFLQPLSKQEDDGYEAPEEEKK